jgi:hypothetical protein
MMRRIVMCGVAGVWLSACAMTPQETAVDLNAAYDVAAAAEAAYAARPDADPVKVAEATRLLAAAQAAILTSTNSSSPADQTAAAAAVAALVAYQAALPAQTVATANH